MAISASFLEFAKETFEPFGAIAVRRMFGGAGVYCDQLFFAILDDEAVYFKVDDVTRAAFERAGLSPFQFEMKDGSMASMSYYNAPESIFDDADELNHWTTLALDAARRSKRLNGKKPAKAAPNKPQAGKVSGKKAAAKKVAAKRARPKKAGARRKPASLKPARKR